MTSGIDWEKSKALTDLKRDLLKALYRYSNDFFLTGGSALGIFYLEHRFSYDLDLFTLKEIDWHHTENMVRAVCEEIGATGTQRVAAPFFRRYEISRGEERETVDIVVEKTPQVFGEKNDFDGIIVDRAEEIAVNKWCTLLGRLEVKDIIDLYFLQNLCNIWELFPKTSIKEGGMEPTILGYLMSQIKIDEVPSYMIKTVSVDQLRGFVQSAIDRFGTSSFPE